jgi:uncharacterized protein YodC (DUF2158 family)
MFAKFGSEDRVRLVAGGPLMAVKGYDRAGRVICSWYVTREGWQQQTFEERQLQLVRRARSGWTTATA